jgi:hypothetical protein
VCAAIHAALFFGVNVGKDIKVLHLTGKPGFEFGGIKGGDGCGPAFPSEQAVPKRLRSVADRGYGPNASYNNALQFHKILS